MAMNAMKYAYDCAGNLCMVDSVGRDLACTVIGVDGVVKTSNLRSTHNVVAFDLCLSKDQECCVVIGTKKSCGYVFVQDGHIVQDRLASLTHSASQWSLIKSIPSFNRCIMCSSDAMYSLEAIQNTEANLAYSKAKVNVNSEIGPQNKLLLSKDKSALISMHDVNRTSSDVLIITAAPSTSLCTVHYATADLPGNSLNLRWSLALPTDRVIVATNCSTAAAHPKGFTWTCIVVGTQLRVVTPTLVQPVLFELHLCPTAAVIVSSDLSEDLIASYAITYTAAVVLSVPGDRYFELVLRVTDGACTAESIREMSFRVPSERPHAAPTTDDEPARPVTRTELPCCETLARVDVSWLRGDDEGEVPLPLVLIGYHSRYGMQMIVEDTAEALLTSDQKLRLANVACAVRKVAYRTFQTQSLENRAGSRTETRRVLASSFCPNTRHSTLHKLALDVVRMETQARFDLDEASFFIDTQVHVCSERTDTSTGDALVMLTSRRANQTALYRLTAPQRELTPFGQEYISDESSLDLVQFHDCAVQVTPSGVLLLESRASTSSGSGKFLRWDALIHEGVTSGVKLIAVDAAGERSENRLSMDSLAGFQAQFVVRAGAQLIVVSNDLLVVAGIRTVRGALSVGVLQFFRLHGVVSGLASSGEVAGSLICVSFWPQSKPEEAHTAPPVQLFHLTSEGEFVFACLLTASTREGDVQRHLAVLPLDAIADWKMHTVLCAGTSGNVVIHHVRNLGREQTQTQSFHLAGGIEAVAAMGDRKGFLLRSRTCEYVIRTCTHSDYGPIWRCSELSTVAGARRCSLATWSASALSGSSTIDINSNVAWVDVASTPCAAGGLCPRICFGKVDINATFVQPEHRLDIPGRVASLGLSPCKRRMAVLSCDGRGEEVRLARRHVVWRGELSLVDTTSFEKVWRQSVASGAGRLLGAVVGPTHVSASIDKQVTTGLSLIEARVTCLQDAAEVLSGVIITTIQLAEEERLDKQSKVRATPVGNLTIDVDPTRLYETPPAPEVSTTTGTAVPPPEPRLQGFVNDALHFERVADCVVLCLPGNVLSLVGWEAADGGALRLSEHHRVDLQDKNGAVLEMVVAGDRYVILSLAMIGIEIYTLCAARGEEKPSLQFVHAIPGVAAIWSELHVQEFSRHEAGDATLLLTVTERVKETKHCINVFLPGELSILKGASIQCSITDNIIA